MRRSRVTLASSLSAASRVPDLDIMGNAAFVGGLKVRSSLDPEVMEVVSAMECGWAGALEFRASVVHLKLFLDREAADLEIATRYWDMLHIGAVLWPSVAD